MTKDELKAIFVTLILGGKKCGKINKKQSRFLSSVDNPNHKGPVKFRKNEKSN